MPDVVEREAVKALRGVGGPREWWIYSGRLVGHLRVGVTEQEWEQIPIGVAAFDAGDSGPERSRTR